uniref:Uncharacterized protein n=1 Tax=viral metagenome TaxID=1070528 RepID=A0A6H2A434_9ZZZZ
MIKVEIPCALPNATNPNWKGHWAVRAKAVKQFRADAYFAALVWGARKEPPYKKATVTITLIVPDKRYIRDPDNALASLKPAIDGCVDAGIIKDDDDLSFKPVIYEIDRGRAPLIILEFHEENPDPPVE